jgi:hypothetical protein
MEIRSDNYIIEKLINLIHWLTRGHWQMVPTQTVDALHAEIYQLEKTLAKSVTQPLPTTRKSDLVEPVNERQKIMDLAG